MSQSGSHSSAAIVFGASEWPEYPSLSAPNLQSTLSHTASEFLSYLLSPHGLGLPNTHVQSLFDREGAPGDVLREMEKFLLRLGSKETPISDVIVYFLGHGIRKGGKYFFALRSAREHAIEATALSVEALERTLREFARHTRRYLILDACYSESVNALWPDGAEPALRVPAVPSKGVALLCSSAAHQKTRAFGRDNMTPFTGDFLDIVQTSRGSSGAMSLFEIYQELRGRVVGQARQAVAKIHCPDQPEGDITRIPIFGCGSRWERQQEVDFDRRRGLMALAGAVLFVGGAYVRSDVLNVHPSRSSVAQFLNAHRWVTYDPRGFNPETGQYPSVASLEQDLLLIERAGFTGIVTFTCDNAHKDVAALWKRLAQTRNRNLGIVVGVWDPKNKEELSRAADLADTADAFCVGHNGLTRRYFSEDLYSAITTLRRATGRPVTTTDELSRYTHEIASLGDWVFPDIHNSLNLAGIVSAADIVRESVRIHLEFVRRIALLAESSGRPLMIKMVTFPHSINFGGLDPRIRVDEATQHRFFHELGRGLNAPESQMAVGVNIVAHSAFDIPWKRWPRFNIWDSSTGLIDADGRARLAVGEIVNR